MVGVVVVGVAMASVASAAAVPRKMSRATILVM